MARSASALLQHSSTATRERRVLDLCDERLAQFRESYNPNSRLYYTRAKRHVAIDFETANYETNSAISLAAAVVERDEAGIYRLESHHWYIKPPKSWFVPSFIDLHGITPDVVAFAPNFGDLWHDEIKPVLQDSVLIAHNAAFDRNVLNGCLQHYGHDPVEAKWVCTVFASRDGLPNLERHKLNYVAEHFGIPLKHHDAVSDAMACAEIYMLLRALAGEK